VVHKLTTIAQDPLTMAKTGYYFSHGSSLQANKKALKEAQSKIGAVNLNGRKDIKPIKWIGT